MRVSVQGCLILLLCFVSFSVSAAWLNEPDNAIIYTKNTASSPEQASSKLSDVLAACNSQYPQGCQGESGEKYGQYRYVVWYFDPPECEAWSHEATNETECGTCKVGYVSSVDSGYAAPFQCMLNREPGECSAIGKAEVETSEGAFCVDECEHGMLNGVCLPPPEPEKECTKDSPDYRGVLVQGYGKPVIPACGDFDQCADGKPGKVGLVNGELRCIADDYGQENECAADEIFIVDQYGVICAGLEDTPEEEPTPEDPNTDTDGDGQPDEYNPDNDPNINRKQLDQLNKNQQKGNESLKNLERIGKGTNDRLDDIKQGVNDLVEMGRNGELAGGGGAGGNGEGLQDGEGNDYLEDIKQNTRDTADALEAPEGGLNTDGLGNAPEFGESATRLKNALFGHPTIQVVTTIPTIGTSTTCPTWTIPANDYWDALTLDVHCAILEDYRSTLSVLFLFFWTVVAIFLFLRA